MGLELITIEEFNAFKDEFRREMQSLKDLLADVKGENKKWLRSSEFMKKFGLKSRTTLEQMRVRNEVKAIKKGPNTWYYDADSYLK